MRTVFTPWNTKARGVPQLSHDIVPFPSEDLRRGLCLLATDLRGTRMGETLEPRRAFVLFHTTGNGYERVLWADNRAGSTRATQRYSGADTMRENRGQRCVA